MNVLEKILEELERTRKSIIDMSDEDPELVDVEDWFDNGVDQGKLIAYEVAKEIIRSHMDDCKTFEFDFTGVKSFDCQCGRRYVNTYDDGWISVEERVPEVGENDIYDMQLVTIEDGEVCLGVYHNPENEWWTRRKEGETLYTNKRNVVAWQPLPEHYKPKEKVKKRKNTQQEMEDFLNDK